MPSYIAHRGASQFAPENTLAAFREAKQLGASWIECDISFSEDCHAVVFHDDVLNRTSDGQGKVADKTLTELLQLDVGSWFDPRFAKERMPTLLDVLSICNQLDLGVNLEIKRQGFACQDKFQIILDAIKSVWDAGFQKIVISSFSMRILHFFQARLSEVPRALLMHYERPDWKNVAKSLNCESIHISTRIANPALVEQIKAAGHAVYCYTVNDAEQAQQLHALGIDGVFTDCLFK